MKTLGFLGKPDPDEREVELLYTLGRVIGKSGRELVIVPNRGSVAAVELGVKTEEGSVRHIASGVLTASAHSLVFADERLLTKIVKVYPAFREMPNIFLMSSALEIEKFLRTARWLLEQRGIAYPE